MTRAEQMGQALTYLVAQVAVVSSIVALQVLVFIYGWGLSPRSWWWILGAGLGGGLVLKVLGQVITKAQQAQGR